MAWNHEVAFFLYLAVAASLFVLGVIFLVRREFMPYHAVAVGMPWAEVPENFQILIRALLKFMGGTVITLSVAVFILLLIPFREGASWSLWAIPLLCLSQCAAIGNATTQVVRKTPGRPPLKSLGVAAVICVIAFAISIA